MRSGVVMVGASCALWICAAVGAGAADPAPANAAQMHPLSGEVLFENRCARCHGLGGDGGDGNAPALTGIVGRGVASQRDFVYYSNALKAKGGLWTRDQLDSYIANPQAFAPGADMEINSPDPVERDAIIDYLTTLK